VEYKELLYDVSDAIATITLNRPDKLNAWTMRMEGEYKHAMADAEERDDVRVIVLTGAGRGFCSGADMSLLGSLAGGDGVGSDDDVPYAQPGKGENVREDFRKTYSFPLAIGKPVLCAINGAAVGAGFVHPLYCDMRFASDEARFSTAFPRRGLVAEYGVAWMLPRLIGLENAIDLLFTGRMIDAAEALRLGLVGRVYPHDELMDRVREFAGELATLSSPRSLRIIKRQIWEGQLTDLATATDVSLDEMLESFSGDDFREGIAAFLEKRPPQFTGR